MNTDKAISILDNNIEAVRKSLTPNYDAVNSIAEIVGKDKIEEGGYNAIDFALFCAKFAHFEMNVEFEKAFDTFFSVGAWAEFVRLVGVILDESK